MLDRNLVWTFSTLLESRVSSYIPSQVEGPCVKLMIDTFYLRMVGRIKAWKTFEWLAIQVCPFNSSFEMLLFL